MVQQRQMLIRTTSLEKEASSKAVRRTVVIPTGVRRDSAYDASIQLVTITLFLSKSLGNRYNVQ